MKIDIDRTQDGRMTISSTPNQYDGYPSPSRFHLECSIKNLSPDRAAVASALLFGRWVGSSLEFDDPISPLVAASIANYLPLSTITSSPIDLEPRAIPGGSRRLALGFRESRSVVHYPPDYAAGVSTLLSESSAEISGSILSMHSSIVGSNAIAFAPDLDAISLGLHPHLAVAVLLSEDLGIGSIFIPSNGDKFDESTARAANLLSAVRLGLFGSYA
ncbi:hypothetical protein [Paraoerskovia marina]|uniref:hypothetical protein n=1 Tax=Paraoerskovia marina TaxID=545619 RepID=UPI0012DF2B51|nr:hypothetical protein [Paraoerskovia marina]